MLTQDILNKKILSKIAKIQEKYPELIGLLNESPRNFDFDLKKGINDKALKDYLDSLYQLLKTYKRKSHKI